MPVAQQMRPRDIQWLSVEVRPQQDEGIDDTGRHAMAQR